MLLLVLVAALGIGTTGCYVEDDTPAEESNLDLVLSYDGISLSVTGGTGITTNNATAVPLEANITVGFNQDINPSTLTTGTFKVIRSDNNEVLEGTVSYASRVATFTPARRFVFVSNTGQKKLGLKQDTTYKVVMSAAHIMSTTGQAQGSGDYSFTFKTVDIDFGFYFLGPNGEYEKAIPYRTNTWFDKSRPTVVHFHGWQNNSTADDFGHENPFFFNSAKITQSNNIGLWRDKGFNVCIVYWSQFADEGEVKDAQAKLWMADSDRKDMRYRVRGGSYKEYDKSRNVTQLLYEQYLGIFNGYTGGNIRFLGHSLGNQLATLMAYTISTNINSGTISGYYMPKRLVLLDPFWGKGAEKSSFNKYPGEVCVTYMTEMLKRNNIALEEYRTCGQIGSTVGDSCLNMRKLAAYYRIVPGFLSGTDYAGQHSYAYNWYVMSLAKLVYADKGPGLSGIGAAASDDQVKATQNWDFVKQAIRSTLYKYNNNAGKNTSTPTDDSFSQASGINN